eukprot:562797-Prymnesium_polylepis.2
MLRLVWSCCHGAREAAHRLPVCFAILARHRAHTPYTNINQHGNGRDGVLCSTIHIQHTIWMIEITAGGLGASWEDA